MEHYVLSMETLFFNSFCIMLMYVGCRLVMFNSNRNDKTSDLVKVL